MEEECITQSQCLNPGLTYVRPDCIERESCDRPLVVSRALETYLYHDADVVRGSAGACAPPLRRLGREAVALPFGRKSPHPAPHQRTQGVTQVILHRTATPALVAQTQRAPAAGCATAARAAAKSLDDHVTPADIFAFIFMICLLLLAGWVVVSLVWPPAIQRGV